MDLSFHLQQETRLINQLLAHSGNVIKQRIKAGFLSKAIQADLETSRAAVGTRQEQRLFVWGLSQLEVAGRAELSGSIMSAEQ